MDLNRIRRPFCIVVDKITFLGSTMKEYRLVINPLNKNYPLITSKEAQELIKRDGLIPVLKTAKGCIYDTPEQAFLEKHRGCFAAAERAASQRGSWARDKYLERFR